MAAAGAPAGAAVAAAGPALPPGGPVVVPPPMPAEVAAALPGGAGSQDKDVEDEALPFEGDMDAWLELLRDGYVRQLREENEYPEPPPFHRAIHFAASPGEPIPLGKYPRQALNTQLQLLLRVRAPEGILPGQKGTKGQIGPWIPKGISKGNTAATLAAAAPLLGLQGSAAAALPQILLQMQKGGAAGLPPHLAAQQGQLLLEAAKALAAGGKAGGDQGKGKGKGKGRGKHLWGWVPTHPTRGWVPGVHRTISK
eukprot:CAMPEP_0179040688 /NCGR_PEP_ID=MMETSP0796-20121207/15773_1 /TAXON_ID=73915 /ORGANISM="Pyrodinium bahamense, Strain pbaha01" /LENGTH=253 /DNA_ID=CAMNT_0020737035 /DNA_START=38 /DNA_END=798 /DNA_ORIENTATION=+